VRGFIRGLLLSNTFIDSFYSKNSNYRFVKHCVERVLGRQVYHEAEQIAWSAIVMSKGLQGFIDQLLNSDEYIESFGENTVPYHRRRILPSRTTGEVPFNIASPRYDAYHRDQLGFPQPIWQEAVRTFRPYDQQPKVGDPVFFLDMAKGFTARANEARFMSTDSINVDATVPYRGSDDTLTSATQKLARSSQQRRVWNSEPISFRNMAKDLTSQ
jgi:phycobilisome rod-core linker protein